MLETFGHIYFRCADKLASARGKLHAWKTSHPNEIRVYRDAEAHRLAMEALADAAEVCSRVPLGTLSREIRRTIEECDSLVVDRCGAALRNISERFHDELESKRFVYVPEELVPFYDQNELFGSAVFEKFKNAREDIKSAGTCYALGQSTASVFHLMRGMEVAVRHLARRPNVEITITPQTTWRQITGAMDAKIKAMPETTFQKKRKKELWESARANLHHVGSVWRNGTMHPARTYTQSQAKDVLDACRIFMNDLCAL
ncbi:hypothetical protein LQG66_16480 [Bradyrhizobium ontarionense]|uniref:HEPN domain-containing protein n=1 Tax=Bradyrhizobium ontarionense TaxID=2898149 RepID=A0ABY3RMJ3_9BRAD|nr:hypothetical protein [Bradyrhizobium sp. A19]UFZ07799.1 hypothetical protein LQG66_16480 [Bradyrhizobium sp. A19]